jgi:hypothetical protein
MTWECLHATQTSPADDVGFTVSQLSTRSLPRTFHLVWTQTRHICLPLFYGQTYSARIRTAGVAVVCLPVDIVGC